MALLAHYIHYPIGKIYCERFGFQRYPPSPRLFPVVFKRHEMQPAHCTKIYTYQGQRPCQSTVSIRLHWGQLVVMHGPVHILINNLHWSFSPFELTQFKPQLYAVMPLANYIWWRHPEMDRYLPFRDFGPVTWFLQISLLIGRYIVVNILSQKPL